MFVNSSDGRTSEIVRVVIQRFAEPIELKALAREVGISVSTARRLLRIERGASFLDIRTALRVKAAIDLVHQDPSMKVDALAWSVGWRSRRTLYAAMKRVTGRTLTELRNASRRELKMAVRKASAP